jgi:hypothetical protein
MQPMIAIQHPPLLSEEVSADKELRIRVRYAALRLADGASPAFARKQVMELYRIDAHEAERIVSFACGVSAEEQVDEDRGHKALWYGGMICLGGIAMTSATAGSGPVMLTWGAIVIGAIWFARGIAVAR